MDESEIRLTQYSHGSGCGCKIAPFQLEEILKGSRGDFGGDPSILIGSDSMNDAVAYDLGNQALISTVDFFTPIVDDPYDFGRVAAANALSDVYAMGAKPIFALGILGWPVDKLPTSLASEVLKGARSICLQANIQMAGGHSIDSSEPIFGLSVNGLIDSSKIKSNSAAQADDLLYITKPIGTGILATAIKRGTASKEDSSLLVEQLCRLNSIGELLASMASVHAMTDVTGFGILGHALEMAEASGLSFNLRFDAIPLIGDGLLDEYIAKFMIPDNTFRNFKSYGHKTNELSGRQVQILCDPQTNGGLLISLDREGKSEFEDSLTEAGQEFWCIGEVNTASKFPINII